VIPSKVKHWHAAAVDSSLTHIVITNNGSPGPSGCLVFNLEADCNKILAHS